MIATKTTVSIFKNEQGSFALTASLAVELELDQAQANALVKAAHQVCPYSNAVRGNIDVQLLVTVLNFNYLG